MGELAEPRLVVPERLMIDESARERLERRLAHSPESVVGVAAETSELAPGASYRVHAEWKALDAPAPAPVAPPGPSGNTVVRGAVLLRPDVEFGVHDGSVEVIGGSVVVDAGAHVHDPYGPVDAFHDATERGRPPFPRRPVVVFVGLDDSAEADWVRRLVNRLVRRDIEARIALPNPAPGLQLTRPCRPGAATIGALGPDVVVTMDGAAAEQAPVWCEGNRSTVIVAFDRELLDPMELVSWQIARAQGRLRARIGPHVDVPAFASLVVRLCAGPQPIPPADDALAARTAVHEHWTDGAGGERPACVVLMGARRATATKRVEGLVDNLAATRTAVSLAPAAGGVPTDARHAAIVVLAGATAVPGIEELVAQRERAGLPTAISLDPEDLDPIASAAGAGPQLTVAAANLATACGLAICAPGAVDSAARLLGVRALVVPTLLTRTDAAALRDARVTRDPAAPLVIGWHLGNADAPAPDYAGAAAEGILAILAKRPDSVELVGDPARVPAALRGHLRATVVPESAADAAATAHWDVHVWTPPLVAGRLADDARQFEATSYAGVASVMPAAACESVDGFVSSHVLVQSVDQPEEWANALHHLLDEPARRARRTREALRRADAIDSPAAAKTVVGRFVGWARYRQGANA